jgi:hypothetical protein
MVVVHQLDFDRIKLFNDNDLSKSFLHQIKIG